VLSTSVDLQVTVRVDDPGNLIYTAEVTYASQGDPDSTPNNGITTEDDYTEIEVSSLATLTNDQLVSGLEGESAQWRYYKLIVPSGQRLLNVSTFGGRGDMDLYVRHGALPTTSEYDYRPLQIGNDEWLNIDHPAPGDWFIGVIGYLDFSEANLHAVYTEADLYLNILHVSIVDCPTIRIETEVGNDAGPIVGLDLSAFVASETGGAPFTPDAVLETGPGIYELSYDTAILHGGDIYPRITVTVGSDAAADVSVFNNCTPEGGAIDVWIEDQSIYPGLQVVVPVRVEPIEIGYHVNSFEFDLSYDKDFLNYEGLNLTGALTSNWDLILDNGTVAGKIYIAGADTNNLELEAGTDDVLLALIFTVNPEAINCTDVTFDRYTAKHQRLHLPGFPHRCEVRNPKFQQHIELLSDAVLPR